MRDLEQACEYYKGRSGRPDDRSGRPDDRSGRPDDRSGRPDDRSGRLDDRSGRPDDRNQEAYLITLLYLHFPIRNDLHSLKIHNYNTSPGSQDNYLTSSGLTLNTYKTSRIYGQKYYPTPESMQETLKSWIDSRKDWTYLLGPEPLDKTKMIKKIRKVYRDAVGKELSFCQIRKIKITHEYESVDSISDMKIIADKYMHRLDTELTYYLSEKKEKESSSLSTIKKALMTDTTL